jgi:hypothetical protein
MPQVAWRLLVHGACECGMLRLMGFLEELRRGWISIEGPGDDAAWQAPHVCPVRLRSDS